MTDNQDLSALSIKDLRHLAGEHLIHNRSRLGKEELIQALKLALTVATERAQAPAEAAGGADGVQSSADTTLHHGSSAHALPLGDATHGHTAAVGRLAPEVAPASQAADEATFGAGAPAGAEPEMITPDSVAELGRAYPAAKPALQTSSGVDAEPEVLDAAAVADLSQNGPGGEGERRRRRRRRGRGRGRREGGQDFDQRSENGQRPEGQRTGDAGAHEDDEGEDTHGESGAEGGKTPLAAPAAQAPVRQPGLHPRDHRDQHQHQRPNLHGSTGGPERDQRNDHRNDRNDQRNDRNDQRNDQRQPRQQDGRDQRPPRPRLDGPQRPMPSVLDRLCVFTKGILELCDPTTPTWAQARLSELLAETGVVPIPTVGQPHPDYHQVVANVISKDVPAGHIAVVEAPGFALRGDRGDLFALRKARVRISGSERRDEIAPTQPVHAGDGLAAPAGASEEIRESVPVAVSVPATASVGGDNDNVVTSDSADTAVSLVGLDDAPEVARGDDSQHPRQEYDPDPKAPSAAPRPNPAADRAPQHGGPGRRESGRRDGGGGHGPGHGRQPAAPPAQLIHRSGNEPASDAPMLPLVSQEPTELAARPKAEGFVNLGLNDQILADLAAIGYQQPTPIQSEAIPSVIAGKDILGQAQTGTGKTAAFALPILQRLYSLEDRERKPAALVLCPTRELARQVYSEFMRMAGASGARAVVIYGGTPMDDQIRALERHPHVVVGTPGRIIDHMKRHTLDLSQLSIAVLDEADQMLDIGFWPDVNYIIAHTPPSRQLLLFSATFPDPVKELAAKHMKEPTHIRITPKLVTVEQVDQKYIAVPRERKNELLAHFIETQKPEQLVVFCKTKHQTDRVAEVLKREHMSAAAIHGDLPQSKRERTLLAFRNGELNCLIATNVAARGLDIPTVSHVVNYDIPEAPEEYVHRIGRTARNGAKGIARTFITPEDGQFLLEIEKHIGLLLEEEKIEGFSSEPEDGIKRTIAELPAGAPRILKPLIGGIRLGRRRR